MLQACLNGGVAPGANPAVPVTPSQLADAAASVRAAGADELHVHPRAADASESLHQRDMSAAIAAIRQAVPGMPLGVSTGAWIAPGKHGRLAAIAGWTDLPDYASVNLNEPDAPAVIDLLLGKGVGIEAGIWNVRDAERFVALAQAPRCLRVLIEIMDGGPAAASEQYCEVASVLAAAGIGLPVLLHGQGANAWHLVEEAGRAGHSTRIGFEDVSLLPDGRPAASNTALVEAALRLLRDAAAAC